MDALGFSSCQRVHMSGVWIHTSATQTIKLRSALDPVTKLLTFLCFFISAPPTYLAPTASCAVNMRNKEGLTVDITNTSVCGDDVLDRDVAHQSHVSAHLFPYSPITCESLRGQLFRTTLTLRRFASSLCLCLCLCLCQTNLHMRVARQTSEQTKTFALSTLHAAEKAQQQVAPRLWIPALAGMCLLVQSAFTRSSWVLYRPTACGLHCPFAAAVVTKSRSSLVPSPPSFP